MADLILVGKKGCEIPTVINTMRDSFEFHNIKTKWDDLAVQLDISPDTISRIRRYINLYDYSTGDILSDLFCEWKTQYTHEATLDRLIKALDIQDFTDLAHKLRVKYDVPLQQIPQMMQPQTSVQQAYMQNAPQFYSQFPPNAFVDILGQNMVPQYSAYQSIPTTAYQQPYLHSLANQNPQQQVFPPYPAADVSQQHNKQVGSTVTDSADHITFGGIIADFMRSFNRNKFTDIDVDSRTVLTGSDLNVCLQRTGNHSVVKDKPDYVMPKGFSGYALIMNIAKFPNSQYRHGAQYDSIRMKQLLIQLGYQLLVYDDINAEYALTDVQAIINIFKAQIEKGRSPPSIFVFVGSHGLLGQIVLSDGKPINIYENIVYQFDHEKCPELKGIPKIFVMQCCRNSTKSDSGFTNIDNTLICYATLPNNFAGRDETNGSPYIESLVRIFCEHAYCCHLKQLLHKVEIDLGKHLQQYEDKADHIQQPTVEQLGLFGVLYFNF